MSNLSIILKSITTTMSIVWLGTRPSTITMSCHRSRYAIPYDVRSRSRPRSSDNAMHVEGHTSIQLYACPLPPLQTANHSPHYSLYSVSSPTGPSTRSSLPPHPRRSACPPRLSPVSSHCASSRSTSFAKGKSPQRQAPTEGAASTTSTTNLSALLVGPSIDVRAGPPAP